MKLRGRFTLWFSLAALVPITAATLVTREVLSSSYRDEFDGLRKSAKTQAENSVASIEGLVGQRVQGLASREDGFVGGLLVEMQKSGGMLPALERRKLVQDGSRLMATANLDVLFVLDSSDTVLVAPHNRGIHDAVRPELRERVRRASGAPYFALEPTIRGDTMAAVLVVEAGRIVADQGQMVTVVGGEIVTEEVLAAIRQGPRIDARIVNASGKELLAGAEPWGQKSPIRIRLSGEGGEAVAWLELSITDSELAGDIRNLTIYSFVLVGMALLLMIVLGFVVARRITGDLDALVEAAQAVSRDDFDHRIETRSRDELGEVGNAFNLMLDDLKESKERLVTAERIAAWQEIARSLAHEIKNPLTPIQMSVETMRRSWAKDHPSFAEIFDESTVTILEETGRLKRIVGEFSEFARMPKPTKGTTDINEIVGQSANLYKGSIEIDIVLDAAIPTVQADRDQLTQVVLNLLENARDAIARSERQKIVVSTVLASHGEAAEIRIGDSGPGIDPAARDKIFTPYYTTKGQKGTGLGLATVHRIVSDHGGKIRVETSNLGGAQFVISLPTGPTPLALTYRGTRTSPLASRRGG